MDIQNKDLGKAIITVAENNVYDSQKTYERLTLVKHNGHVYLSKQIAIIIISNLLTLMLIIIKAMVMNYNLILAI